MSKQRKRYYSVLLMRDDTSVKGIRIKSKLLWSLLCFFLLLGIVAVAGVFISARYIERFYTMQAEHKSLEYRLSEARIELEQLSNVKTLVEKSSNGGVVPKLEEITDTPPDPLASSSFGAISSNSTAQTTLSATNTSLEAMAIPASNATAPDAQKPTLLHGILPTTAATSPIEISDFTWRKTQTQIHLSYTLTSRNGIPVAGKSVYYAELKDGSILPLPLRSRYEAGFAISRLKPMGSVINIPSTIQADDLSGLHVVVELENQDKFTFTSAFANE